MSLKSMVWALNLKVPVSHAAARVLFYLAERSDDEGRNIWPSLDTIAEVVQAERATVVRCLAKLEADGIITRKQGGGRTRSTHYELNLAVGQVSETEPPNGETVSSRASSRTPNSDLMRQNGSVNRVVTPQNATPNSDLTRRFAVKKSRMVPEKSRLTTPEPSIEPRKKESQAAPVALEPAAASRAARHAKHAIPKDWTPDEADRDFARHLGLDPDREAAEFRDYWLGEGARKANWAAAFRTRCRRQVDYRARLAAPNPRRPAQNGAIELLLQARERTEAEGSKVVGFGWGSIPDWHGGH